MFKIQPLLDITVKEFVLSKSCSGYALRCQIYTGKNSFLRQKNVPLSIAMGLCHVEQWSLSIVVAHYTNFLSRFGQWFETFA